jgi:hypothetical protein
MCTIIVSIEMGVETTEDAGGLVLVRLATGP